MVYPLFGRKFWETVYGSNDGSKEDSGKPMSGATGESHELTFGSATMNRCKRPKDPYSLTQLGMTQVGESESQEEMIHSLDEAGAAVGASRNSTAGNGTTVSVAVSEHAKADLARTLSLQSGKGRASEKPLNNIVVVERSITTTTTQCPEEQKRRDLEAWRKQPWDAK